MPPDYEMVKVSADAAMAVPKEVYFNQEGVSAYSCLIPVTDDYAHRIHFVSDSGGGEYGQFRSMALARDRAIEVIRIKNPNP